MNKTSDAQYRTVYLDSSLKVNQSVVPQVVLQRQRH